MKKYEHKYVPAGKSGDTKRKEEAFEKKRKKLTKGDMKKKTMNNHGKDFKKKKSRK
jgi:hypothetical protein